MTTKEPVKTAVKIGDLIWEGQAVYRLSHPISHSSIRMQTYFVICSTSEQKWGPFKGEKLTTVHPTDETGVVLGFKNLVEFGPDDPVSTHADVLRLLGFELVEHAIED